MATNFDQSSGIPALIGHSSATESLRTRIASLAIAPVNVVITGESGTGKQLVARSIHALANRTGPFVLVDCPSISEDQVEAQFGQLFDVGERSRRLGRNTSKLNARRCSSGISSNLLPLPKRSCRESLQREAENGANGSPARRSHHRVPRQDLGKLCQGGGFLSDLYYAVAVISLTTVPLRAVREDIPLLLDAFLSDAASTHGRDVPTLDSVCRIYCRTLGRVTFESCRNFALRFVLGLDEDGSLCKRESRSPPLADQVSWFEKEIIVQQLRRYGGNVEAASEVLAVPKTTLYEKLRKHSICARALKCANGFGGVDVRMKDADGHVFVADQKPYSLAGLSTRIRSRIASSGAQSDSRSNRTASSGFSAGFEVGCGQSVPHTSRSGASFT